LLIDAVVQQTMVFIAQLATAGGVRAPLAHVAEQVFSDLTRELSEHGVKKNVIADMFGMALRTYHRKIRELGESKTVLGRSVWEAVLGFVRERGPVTGRDVLLRFAGDDPEVVTGVLGASCIALVAATERATAWPTNRTSTPKTPRSSTLTRTSFGSPSTEAAPPRRRRFATRRASTRPHAKRRSRTS
jgi:hypothetical protein